MKTVLEVSQPCNPHSSEHSELPSLAEFFDDTLEPEHIGTGMPELFEYAMTQRLKYPKIRVRTNAGEIVVLKRASKRSRCPGSVVVVGDGDSFCERTYFGSIGTNGVLYPSAQMTPAIRELLRRLARDPAQVAREQGVLTGHCCFCSRLLSDARSLSHGYGARCAGIYGLPWCAPRHCHGFFGNVWNCVYGVPAEG